jgi:N-acetylglucosamine-6-sulfatase
MWSPTAPGPRRTRVGRVAPLLLLIATVLVPASGLAAEAGELSERAATPPNIVLILTDDQRWDTLRYMPHVRADLMSKGMTFANAFVSNPLCCPSRSTILTGNYSHTTGVYANGGQYGGWQAFHDGGAEASTIATWLHDAGYHTSLLGKYMNHYGPNNHLVPPGWDRWAVFEQESPYYDYTLNVDGSFVSYGHRTADYSTDVLARYAVRDIARVPADQPLFLYLAPSAPHGPATAAPRDLGTVSAGGFHPAPSFNERNMRDKPRYMRRLPLVSRDKEAQGFVKRVETLGAVDDAVHEVVGALGTAGRLDNTLIVFASDNGFASGEHRWTYKLVPYEESIRIPLVMRWDGEVSPGVLDRNLVANVDFAPTFSEAAGVVPPTVEGRSLVPLLRGEDPAWRGRFLLEHLWYHRNKPNPPTYCGVRSRGRVFVHYASGFEEYYNLRADPYELRNAIDQASQVGISHLRNATRQLCQPLPPGMSPF